MVWEVLLCTNYNVCTRIIINRIFKYCMCAHAPETVNFEWIITYFISSVLFFYCIHTKNSVWKINIEEVKGESKVNFTFHPPDLWGHYKGIRTHKSYRSAKWIAGKKMPSEGVRLPAVSRPCGDCNKQVGRSWRHGIRNGLCWWVKSWGMCTCWRDTLEQVQEPVTLADREKNETRKCMTNARKHERERLFGIFFCDNIIKH